MSAATPGPASRREARGGVTGSTPGTTSNPTPKAGRDLPMAIGVGLFLGALVLASLLVRKELFVVLATAASMVAVFELLNALSKAKVHPPTIPTLAASVAIPVVAYVWGPRVLAPAIVVGVLAILAWGAAEANSPDAVKDVAGGVLITLYVPSLVAFAMMLLEPDDGVARIVTFVIVTISSDIGGYAVGVIAGKHPMAPTVSPKKSWEGFAGSAVSCIVAGAVCVMFALDGDWWAGALLGALVVVAATVGDLCESMIKRDLGIKDMSNLIPGHGGLMDRLDSLLLAAPVTWAVLTQFVS
ncbi:phosphatidate cytidylyltransferase [Luteipulveratus mongoliensis]|uniref:Phosphatidate cytidylyltransferase n=1 Tax=Luteipulveratus mongoliensis TaxID=571913 RepID=A0A0K1JIK6_9MICO|nr:phosphatidate cytidylyltransferase [Luteipulveratus mongoliensis]AKU16415.1 phosphatidate cytidylyltransferase [Luteipulveratus mongoliensis]